eukprot:1153088-Pelagomonas_calceolata.AAC.7
MSALSLLTIRRVAANQSNQDNRVSEQFMFICECVYRCVRGCVGVRENKNCQKGGNSTTPAKYGLLGKGGKQRKRKGRTSRRTCLQGAAQLISSRAYKQSPRRQASAVNAPAVLNKLFHFYAQASSQSFRKEDFWP